MRGKEGPAALDPLPLGITPAYAGKSDFRVVVRLKGKDHPRVCGEKRNGGDARGDELGSPPRMRGKGLLSKKCLL